MVRGGLWQSWGASVTGPGHFKYGLPNQDAWATRHFSWGAVAVVADGLGSRPKSDIGSQAVCAAVLQAARLYNQWPHASADQFLRLVHALWLMSIVPQKSRDCAATCLMVIARRDTCLLAQLGDGMIAACAAGGGEPILLTDNKEGSFSNLTYSMGEEYNYAQWHLTTVPTSDYEAFVLCTDGIADDLQSDKQSDFARSVCSAYRHYPYSQRKRELKRWLTDWPVPGHSDDKTIACLYKKSEDQ